MTQVVVPQVRVAMGEYAVGTSPQVLRTCNLGSCVGVAIYDVHLLAGGLAHVMHPGSGNGEARPDAYADVAIGNIVQELLSMGGMRLFMVAKIAGGANMFGFEPTSAIDVGTANLASVRQALASERVAVVAEDVGENRPRSMTFDLATGGVHLESQGDVYRTM